MRVFLSTLAVAVATMLGASFAPANAAAPGAASQGVTVPAAGVDKVHYRRWRHGHRGYRRGWRHRRYGYGYGRGYYGPGFGIYIGPRRHYGWRRRHWRRDYW